MSVLGPTREDAGAGAAENDAHVTFTLGVLQFQIARGCHGSAEQPNGSGFYRRADVRSQIGTIEEPKVPYHFAKTPMCQYGAREPPPRDHLFWRKLLIFVATSPRIEKIIRVCDGSHKHIAVRGTCKLNGKWISR